MEREHFSGAAVSTPLTSVLDIDHGALVAHIGDLRARGIDLLTLFGTTGEGASFTTAERCAALEACAEAGTPADQLGCGVFALSSADAGRDAQAFFNAGCGHVLLAPPSYYKGVDDEGLFRWFSAAIESAGPTPGHFVLYHIPSVTQIELSVSLVTRLAKAFPRVVAGVKDSSGNWPHTQQLIKQRGDLRVFVGHEGQLEQGMRAGASGAIAGTGNFIPEVIHAIVHQASNQPNLPDLIDALLQHPVIPAVKAMTAHRLGAPSWLHVRPPFNAMGVEQAAALGARLDALFPA